MNEVTPPRDITLADIQVNEEQEYRFKVYRTYYWVAKGTKFYAAAGRQLEVHTYSCPKELLSVDIPVFADFNKFATEYEGYVDHILRGGYPYESNFRV